MAGTRHGRPRHAGDLIEARLCVAIEVQDEQREVAESWRTGRVDDALRGTP